MSPPDLSVIIPLHNGLPHIENQLRSLSRQDCPFGWEVIVVDNLSSDGGADVVAGYSSVLPDLRVLSEARPGKAHALNQALSAARGRNLVFLDQDDQIQDGYLQAMASGLERFDLVGARVDRDSLNPPWARFQGGQTDGLCTRTGCPPFAIGAALGTRTKVAQALRFDPDLGASDDIDFCWRAQKEGYRLGFVPDAVLRYRQRSTAREAYRQGLSYGRAEVLIYLRYRSGGHPRKSLRAALWTYKSLLGLLLGSADRTKRTRFCYWSGIVIGKASGSLRARVVYL
jgi:glycosyltransferase involved in cell wall biosynthesis